MTSKRDAETIRSLEATLEKECNANDELKEKLQEVKEELAHYRAAVAAMKWLWDQAQSQRPFQL